LVCAFGDVGGAVAAVWGSCGQPLMTRRARRVRLR
jgi:hypothetical protein